MNEQYLLDSTSTQVVNESCLFLHPRIPLNKLTNAIKSYGDETQISDVLILIDDTAFGGAKDGLMITKQAIKSKEFLSKKKSFELSDIKSIRADNKTLYINQIEFCKLTLINKAKFETLIRILSSALELSSDTPEIQNIPLTHSSPQISTKDFGLPDANVKNSFFQRIHSSFIQKLKEDELPNELIKFYMAIFNLILNFPKLHEKNEDYKPYLNRLYHNDLAMGFCLSWSIFSINSILAKYEFDAQIMNATTFALNDLLEQYVFFQDSDHFNTLSAKANMQKAVMDSDFTTHLSIWAQYFRHANEYLSSQDDDGFARNISSAFYLSFNSQYEEFPKYLQQFSDSDEDLTYLVKYLKFMNRQIETYLNVLL